MPGSFRPAYADTDSMVLGLSRTKPISEDATLEEYYRSLFDPLVKPVMRESWEAKWKDWICTTTAVEDQRKPGKFKSKSHTVAYRSMSYPYLYPYIVFSYLELNFIFRGIFNVKWSLRGAVAKVLSGTKE